MLKYHPDRNHGDEARVTAKFREVQSSYEILFDEGKRKEYDRQRRAYQESRKLRKRSTARPSFRKTYGAPSGGKSTKSPPQKPQRTYYASSGGRPSVRRRMGVPRGRGFPFPTSPGFWPDRESTETINSKMADFYERAKKRSEEERNEKERSETIARRRNAYVGKKYGERLAKTYGAQVTNEGPSVSQSNITEPETSHEQLPIAPTEKGPVWRVLYLETNLGSLSPWEAPKRFPLKLYVDQ